ncbi:MAG: GatB/YqeY domain-containing protein [Gemmatimonadales bacterium]|nr:MAG: GatB/YqeY domain-containing protein [Gemmatimonadales bacterium]
MSAPLQTRLEAELVDARRARDRSRTALLSMTLSEVHNRRIEMGRDLTDEDVREVLTRARKRRQEAADQMRAGGREELARKEEAESEALSAFLPRPMEEEDVRALVRGLIAEGVGEIGPLMGRLMPLLKGRFDGKEANRIAREELAGA